MASVTQHVVPSKGRLKEVLIVNKRDFIPREFQAPEGMGGVELLVWADAGYLPVIQKVEGVAFAYNGQLTRYDITIDPRYDVEIVKKEIEAAILCNKPDERAILKEEDFPCL